jgi:transposase InsO family protein
LTIYRSFNALVESFFGTLQLELLNQHAWASRDDRAGAIFEWIEAWYNPSRRHSALDWLSPLNYERAHTPVAEAA